MIILSFALASCTGNNAEPAETGATTTVTTTATTTVGDGTSTSRCETTVAETVTTAAEETEEPTIPEFDINSEECLMYRLLDMTVEEIEAEFGKLELYAIIAGGTPCYEIPEYGVFLYFAKYSDDIYEPLPRNLTANFAEIRGYDGLVYPGVYIGMDSKELIDKFGIEHFQFSMGEIRGGFTSTYRVNEKYFWVRWELPEDVMLNIEYTALNCDGNEYDALIEEVISKMRSGEVRGKVLHIGVS